MMSQKQMRRGSVSTLLFFTLILSSASARGDGQPKPNQYFWPEQLDLAPLRAPSPESNPFGADFSYAREFKSLDLSAVKTDIAQVLTTSQPWWPADYGTYAPFFIRMAWHGAGTYRIFDGRGGAEGAQQRFEPLGSWPDNVSLDKARRLLWPVKKKYGRKISWGDLMVLAGNVALDSMGFKPYGFGGGRKDDWEPDTIYWGSGAKMLTSNRDKTGKFEKPLGATQMGLIYVNPEGPNGKPDPIAAARDIRESFGRMAMNDEETVALIAGGHTFGKSHGAGPAKCVGPAPAGEGVERQGLGWVNRCGSGRGKDTIGSGLEGAWSADPVHFTSQYFDNLFGYDWVQTKSPYGATQWKPKNKDTSELVPDAHDPNKKHPPMMFTTDLAIKLDPAYKKIAESFHKNPDAFKTAFAKAWFKLTHRDMGPRFRYLGPEVPKEDFIWQDPTPPATYKAVEEADVAKLKASILASGVPLPRLIITAWASAASFRATDKRGGANGARIRLAPENTWAVNEPKELAKVLSALETVKAKFDGNNPDGKKVSIADLIVLAGSAAIEEAAKKAGHAVKVPFAAGRTDATAEQTDTASFTVLEPLADGFRNYYAAGNQKSAAQLLVERAGFLHLTVPEMTVLLGGLRALGANAGLSEQGVLTNRPGTLNNDFFVTLMDSGATEWTQTKTKGVYEGRDAKTHAVTWTASGVDLIFGAHPELRAVAEVYASDDGKDKFLHDFVKAWAKVMDLDRADFL